MRSPVAVLAVAPNIVTVAVPDMVFEVPPPWLSNLAAPLPLLVIAKEMVADGFTVIVTVAVLPFRIGFCENVPIVTVGVLFPDEDPLPPML